MSTDNDQTEQVVEPLTPGSWCGERYAKLLGREIAEEVLNGDKDGGAYEADDETRSWWVEFYGELRSLDLRDHDEVAAFLRKHYGQRVGDLNEDELTACAEVFAEVLQREQF